VRHRDEPAERLEDVLTPLRSSRKSRFAICASERVIETLMTMTRRMHLLKRNLKRDWVGPLLAILLGLVSLGIIIWWVVSEFYL
jgi:hypothetical protein